MLKRINRVHEERFLNEIYAPNEKPGRYFILSEYIAEYSGFPTVVGHVLKINGKPTRTWMNF